MSDDTEDMADSSDSFDWQSLSDTLNSNHVPEIVLILVGVIALLIVFTYLKDRESGKYKLMVLLGVILGVIMIALCLTSDLKTATGTTIIVAIGCFALIIRPFRDVHFAVILAALVMVIVYILLGDITKEPFDALNNGWPRIIVAFVAGSITYMLLNFLQALVLGAAKILNAWPILAVVGIICIAEAICVWMGYDSVYDTIVNLVKDKASSSSSEIFMFR